MKTLNFKDFEKISCNEQFIIEDGKIKGIKILDNIYDINRIPHIESGSFISIYVLSKNMSDYIIYENEIENIKFMIQLEQDVVNNTPKILHLYTTLIVSEENFLSDFVEFSKAICLNLLSNKFPKILSALPYNDDEVEWYIKEITELSNKPKDAQKVITNNKKSGRPSPKKYVVDGVEYTNVQELCRIYNIRSDTFRSRLEKGMSVIDALTTPVQKTGRALKAEREKEMEVNE